MLRFRMVLQNTSFRMHMDSSQNFNYQVEIQFNFSIQIQENPNALQRCTVVPYLVIIDHRR